MLGVALFALFALRDETAPPVRAESVIAVTPEQARRLAASFEATWRRPPTDAELSALIDAYIEEEVYYREALALGLDGDDTVIRRRLRQKMEYLTASRAHAAAPSDAQLRAHHARNIERFTEPARLTFTQVFLGAEPPDAETEAARAALAQGGDPRAIGRPTLLPGRVERATEGAVDGTFGPGFFARVVALEPGAWAGPARSTYGLHLVRVTAAEPPRIPPFETARAAVELDWRRDAAEALQEQAFLRLRERYAISRPDAISPP